jgi:hypothetical protein
VIVQVKVFRFTFAAVPPKHQTPSTADAYRMVAGQVASQLFEMIAGRYPQISIGCGVVDHLELPKKPALQIGRDVARPRIIDEKDAQPLVPE